MIKLKFTEELYNYVLKHGVRPNQILDELDDFTSKLPQQRMQSTPDQIRFMMLLAKLINAKNYLEIGTFVGYSSLSMAIAMGPNSRVVTLDINQDYINIAKQFWQKANVINQIEAIVDDANTTLANMSNDDKFIESFDIAFIDGNKKDYSKYYEYCYKLVRRSGVIIIDNTLMAGKVILNNMPNYVEKIKEFNNFIYQDERVDMVMLPFADGITIAYKN
jgi:O-methyltransferase